MSAQWWDGEPAPVRAVLDLAWMKPEFGDDTFARILDTFAPGRAEIMLMIADDLTGASRFDTESAADSLSAYYEQPVVGIHLDRAADEIRDLLRGEALRRAQFLASLLTRPPLVRVAW